MSALLTAIVVLALVLAALAVRIRYERRTPDLTPFEFEVADDEPRDWRFPPKSLGEVE